MGFFGGFTGQLPAYSLGNATQSVIANWVGPSTSTQWIRALKVHLNRGGSADLLGLDGHAARVAGLAGFAQPRTSEAGSHLRVAAAPVSTRRLTEFAHSIIACESVFVTRRNAARDTLPTASKYRILLPGETLVKRESAVGGAPPRSGRPPFLFGEARANVKNMRVAIQPITYNCCNRRVLFSTRLFPTVGMGLSDVTHPRVLGVRGGCNGLSRDYYARRGLFALQIVINAAVLAGGGGASTHLGEHAGRAHTESAVIYATFLGLFLGCLILGCMARIVFGNGDAAFSRWFPWRRRGISRFL